MSDLVNIEAPNLPSLIDRAASALASARTSGEVLEARDAARVAYDAAKTAGRMARVKNAHDAVLSAVYRAQADALLIEARAKVRLADEYDAAQERGEVATGREGKGLGVARDNAQIATAADLGLRRDEIHEARQLRDAEAKEPGLAERAMLEMLRTRREPTRAELRRVAQEVTKEVRAEKQAEKRAARTEKLVALSQHNAPLPQDRTYPVIYADPPWEYDFSPSSGRAVENHYPTMPIEEILAMPVADLATPDAMLFLWAPPSFIKKGIAVLEAWGFELASSMVWDKEIIGTGIYFRQQHEYLLLGKRGRPITPAPGTQPRSIFREKRTAHSAKPAGFYGLIDQMYPGLPKIELFSRSPREGWDAWGNQAHAA